MKHSPLALSLQSSDKKSFVYSRAMSLKLVGLFPCWLMFPARSVAATGTGQSPEHSRVSQLTEWPLVCHCWAWELIKGMVFSYLWSNRIPPEPLQDAC